MKLGIRKPFQILLLCFVMLSLYYITIFSETCLLDDRDVIIGLQDIEHFDLKSIFFPNTAHGGYYRPLIGVFQLIDRFAWGLESRIMHFENILFHLVNVVLMFLIATELIKVEEKKSRYLPLLSALLFAVHPIATESVNWISGRTDSLMGIFLLFATFILIRFRKHQKWWLWPAVVGCVLFGMLAKETAVAFVIVSFFLFRMKVTEGYGKDSADDPRRWRWIVLLTTVFYAVAVLVAIYFYNYFLVLLVIAGYGVTLYWWDIGTSRREYLKLWLSIGVTLFFAVLLFIIVRKLAFTSDIARIPQTLTLIKFDPIYAVKVYTGAIGFYVKKFMFPFPLNLAIREIDPLYELLGILLLLLSVLFVRLGGVVSSLSLAGLCLIAPALPLSMGTLAWTAYAERYIYLAIPFWLLAMIVGWNSITISSVWTQRIGMVTAGIFVIVWTAGTFKRNMTWQTNLGVFEDTVRKSPNFKVTRGLYMLALYENGRYDDAVEQYRIACTLQSLVYDEKFDILYSLIQMRKGRTDEARLTLESVLQKKETVSVLENLLKLLKSMRDQQANNEPLRQKTNVLIIQYYERLYSKTGDALYLYRMGQDYLKNGKRAEAKSSFTRAALELPESSEFKQYAHNLAMKL